MKKYLVGGAVRDELLQLPIVERDWVVVGATPEIMLTQGYKQVGKGFPVFLHPDSHEEYALARTERKSGTGYLGFNCYFSPQVTLEEDLYRRDLTINAIARDEVGNFIDPYQGQYDIHKRWLRNVSEAFCEDPMRVLRVARFAAQFHYLNFRIVPSTLNLMKNMVNELTSLSSERIWKETEKALMTNHPQVYFQVLHNCGALKIIFPEIDMLFSTPSSILWKMKLDTGIHTMMVLSMATSLSNDLAIRFASLCHNLGEIITFSKVWPNHHEHSTITGIALIESLCKRLKIPNQLRDLAKLVVRYHNTIHSVKQITPTKLIELFNNIDVWRNPNRLDQIITTSEAIDRVNLGNKNSLYDQGDFLRKAYRITQSIDIQDIIQAGFYGIQISKELNIRRQHAIELWKNTL